MNAELRLGLLGLVTVCGFTVRCGLWLGLGCEIWSGRGRCPGGVQNVLRSSPTRRLVILPSAALMHRTSAGPADTHGIG